VRRSVASWAAGIVRNARNILGLIGIGWVSGLTKYPEFFFLLGVFGLYGKYLSAQFAALHESYYRTRAINLLREDWHAPVSGFDVFNGRQEFARAERR
jgi:hypothetical protein